MFKLNFLFFIFISCSTLRKPHETIRIIEKCDINVSFRSLGAGIDRKTHKAFSEYITHFEIEEKVQLFFDKTFWGREGEIDYCISTKNLSDKQIETFENQIKVLLVSSKSVYYSRDTEKRKGR